MVSIRPRNLSVLAVALFVAAVTPLAVAQGDAPMPNPPPFPDENPLLPDQDILGKFLFWEEQLSEDNTMSCGTCHIHEAGGSDPRVTFNPGADGMFGTADDVRGSAGVVRQNTNGEFLHEGTFFPDAQVTGRRSPSPINAAYFNSIFWDGRAVEAYTDPQSGLVEIAYLGALESQAAGPPVSDVEMSPVGHTWDDITDKLPNVVPMALATNLPPEMADFLNDNPTYPQMFEAVYGDQAITSKRINFAIANYERTLIADQTILDDFLRGDIADFTGAGLQAGHDLFVGSANCAVCHIFPFTMDNDFHNIGVRPDLEDLGREDFTSNPADRAKFKTPQLRNSKLRTPLFHNGSAVDVADVIEFYSDGGDFDDGNLDPNILVLNLTAQEQQDLVDFIEIGMTDARVENEVFPFTRPTLLSETGPPNITYGTASPDGSAGFAGVLTHVPANLGHDKFSIGLYDAVPLADCLIVFAFLPDLAGTPFPDPRFPVPMNIDLTSIFLVVETTTDANGVASVNLPIPGNAALDNVKIYAQWLIEDASALATGGVYGTEGMEFQIF